MFGPARNVQPSRQRTTVGTIPAPEGGINSVDNLFGMPPTEAIYMFNVDPTEYGSRIRSGYREWADPWGEDLNNPPIVSPTANWDDTLALDVKTILPYRGTAEDGSEDKLFCATDVGIYDITIYRAEPTLVYAWPNTVSAVGVTDAGWCSYTQHTLSDVNYLLICSEEEGYFYYTPGGGWFQPSLTGGPGEAEMAFVMVWKNRIWLIERGSGDAWFLGTGAVSGSIAEFQFGTKFRYGGNLIGLYNWSYDSGIGPDDYLVAVGKSGDVLVYGGTDPASVSTFGLVGSWFIGAMPAGRRVATEFGGDLFILSTTGLSSLAALMKGSTDQDVYDISNKISRLITGAMAATRDNRGWEVRLHPAVNSMIVLSPKEGTQRHIQFVYNTETKSWTMWRDIPMLCGEQWKGEFYFGTAATYGTDPDFRSKVFELLGTRDAVYIEHPTDPENNPVTAPLPIEFSFLTSYQSMNSPGIQKRVQLIRPFFIASGTPAYSAEARYDYDLSESTIPTTVPTAGDTEWDVSLWDEAVWGSETGTEQAVFGSSGIGTVVAIAIRGSSYAVTTFIAVDVMWDSGGML